MFVLYFPLTFGWRLIFDDGFGWCFFGLLLDELVLDEQCLDTGKSANLLPHVTVTRIGMLTAVGIEFLTANVVGRCRLLRWRVIDDDRCDDDIGRFCNDFLGRFVNFDFVSQSYPLF